MRLCSLISLAAALFAFAGPGASSARPQIVRHVVVIGVDGMSPAGVRRAETPVMDSLMAGGAYTLQARGVLPTSSSPNWASMIMGAGPEQHGITSNSWEPDRHTLPAAATGPEALFPTIFSVIRAQRPDAILAAVYHWDGFGRLFEKSVVDVDLPGADEFDTARKAGEVLRTRKPTFLFVHLDHVDHAGHHDGHGTPAYLAAVTRADSLIGTILQAARAAGVYEHTLFLVTADHGGVGYGHGGETPEEIEIPFLLFGQGVKKGHALRQPVFTYDNAATVAFALGLEAPYAWIGRPVRSAFEGFEEPALHAGPPPAAPPVIYPERQFNAPAGGLYLDSLPRVRIAAGETGGTIRYTLDGTEPTAGSPVYTNPFALETSTVVRARLFDAEHRGGRTAAAFFRLGRRAGEPPIRYRYYEGTGWTAVPNLERLTPVRTGLAWEFRLDSLKASADTYAARFESRLRIDTPGRYTFCTVSDDGSNLYVGPEQVVDNDGAHGVLERCGDVTLEAGLHPLAVTYFQGGGGGWLDVYFAGPETPYQIIPPDRLVPPGPGEPSSGKP